MLRRTRGARRGFSLRVLALLLAAPALLACRQSPAPAGGATAAADGHVISGRVVDPQGLKPEGASLVLVAAAEPSGSITSTPVPIGPDGSFVTPPLRPASYVLEMVRAAASRNKPALVVGFRTVSVGNADVTGVTVEVRRDTALTGRFRMETDNPAAEWPQIVVNAFLALDGKPLMDGTTAEAAPAGSFVLRNAFGPRVVRCGYSLVHGHGWWPTRVLLNGADITNVPTDFSAQDGALEVVFTQHPSAFRGTITDQQGAPAKGAWVIAFAADRALWQEWATTSHAVQADAKGAFDFASLPGRYLVRALPPTPFSSRRLTPQQMAGLATQALTVDLPEREVKTLTLTVDARLTR